MNVIVIIYLISDVKLSAFWHWLQSKIDLSFFVTRISLRFDTSVGLCETLDKEKLKLDTNDEIQIYKKQGYHMSEILYKKVLGYLYIIGFIVLNKFYCRVEDMI